MRICHSCSKENPDYIKHCLDCGRNIDPSSKSFSGAIYFACALTLGAAIAFFAVRNHSIAPGTNGEGIESPHAKAVEQAPFVSAPVRKTREDPAKESPIPAPTPPAALLQLKTDGHIAGPEKGAATTITAAESTRPVPRPRRRLEHQSVDTADILTGNTPANLKINGPVWKDMAGIKSSSEAYMRMLQHVIAVEYNRALKKQYPTSEIGDPSPSITLLVDCRSGEFETLKISSGLDSQKQNLLRTVIAQCSGRIPCPSDLYGDVGEHVKLDFPLKVTGENPEQQ